MSGELPERYVPWLLYLWSATFTVSLLFAAGLALAGGNWVPAVVVAVGAAAALLRRVAVLIRREEAEMGARLETLERHGFEEER